MPALSSNVIENVFNTFDVMLAEVSLICGFRDLLYGGTISISIGNIVQGFNQLCRTLQIIHSTHLEPFCCNEYHHDAASRHTLIPVTIYFLLLLFVLLLPLSNIGHTGS